MSDTESRNAVASTNGDGTAPFEFGRVLDGALMADGSYIVAETHEPAVHVFSADGRWKDRVIRAGAGPGEFRTPVQLGFRGAGGWVIWDGELGRALELDTNLQVVHYLRAEHRGSRIIGRLPDGREIQARWLPATPAVPSTTPAQDTPPNMLRVLLVAVDSATAEEEVLSSLSITGDEVDASGNTRRVLLARNELWATTPDGPITASTHGTEVRWIRTNGDHLSIATSFADASADYLTDSEKDQVRDEHVEEFRRRQRDPEGILGRMTILLVERARVEDVWPTIDALVGSTDGQC